MVGVVGIVVMAVFYLLVLLVGLWAGRKRTKGPQTGKQMGSPNLLLYLGGQAEEAMLAGRSIGTVVGIFTMTGVVAFS